MDAAQGPDSDDYFKATGRNASCDVETRVQKLNFLSTSRSPSAQKDQPDGREPQAAKAKKDKKSKPEEDVEAHVLGAWLQDEHVLELLKIHAGGKKKKDNTGSIYTTSQSEVAQREAKGLNPKALNPKHLNPIDPKPLNPIDPKP
ncbi:unnamed protein product [Symbiodinium sp. KB8]|nr:unnamed protein product [Symbiodinium sp. KB8]